MAVRLQLKLGVVTEQDRLPDSPDVVVVVEPSVGSVARTKGNLYLLVTSRITGPRALEATRVVAETIRNEYYYDESAGIRQCLTKVLGIANKRLAHQRDRLGLHGDGTDGPIGVGVAVVRGSEMYVATVGPAEAYLIRQARLSTLPDPHRERGLPSATSSPRSGAARSPSATRSAWSRPTWSPGSGRIPSRTPLSRSTRSPPWSTSTPGSWRPTARAATAPSRSRRPRSAPRSSRTLVPVRPAEPLAGAPDRSPIPLADSVTAGAAAIGAGATRARDAAGNGFQRLVWRIQDHLPHRRRGEAGQHRVVADGDPASRRRGPPGVRHRGRRPRPRRLRRRRPAPVHGDHQVLQGGPAGVRGGPEGVAMSGPGIDLIANDPKRALELLSTAYAELDKAEQAGYPLAQIKPLRQTALDGLDRLYGVVKVASTDLFTFPATRRPVPWRASSAGRTARPTCSTPATKTVWRIDLGQEDGDGDPEDGQKTSSASGRRPEAPHDRRPRRPDPRFEERPLALAPAEPDRQGHAGQDQRHGLRVLGHGHPGHRHVRRQLRRGVLQALRRGPVRAEHHRLLAQQRRLRLLGRPPQRRLPTDRPVDGITDLLIDGDIYAAENGAVERMSPATGWKPAPLPGHRPPPDGDVHAARRPTGPTRTVQPPAAAPVRLRRHQPPGGRIQQGRRRVPRAVPARRRRRPAGPTSRAWSWVSRRPPPRPCPDLWWISGHGPPLRAPGRRARRASASPSPSPSARRRPGPARPPSRARPRTPKP